MRTGRRRRLPSLFPVWCPRNPLLWTERAGPMLFTFHQNIESLRTNTECARLLQRRTTFLMSSLSQTSTGKCANERETGKLVWEHESQWWNDLQQQQRLRSELRLYWLEWQRFAFVLFQEERV